MTRYAAHREVTERHSISMAREYAEVTGRSWSPIERLARTLGVRASDHGSIFATEPPGRPLPDGDRAAAHKPDEEASVTCWCEASIVAVPLGDVRAGRTGSCGRNGCIPHRHAVELGPTLGGRREH